MNSLEAQLTLVRGCTVCAPYLPLGPRPIVQVEAGARILIVGQAPGAKVHASGVPWDDASGTRLRAWLGMDEATFYDPEQIALLPMGFCYPGNGAGGDMAPRPECAPLWHDALLSYLPHISLTVLIGGYAHARYLAADIGTNSTDTVRNWASFELKGYFPLVHPSPRNNIWLKKNPWFEQEVVPALKKRVLVALSS